MVQLARAEVSHNPSAAGPVRAFAQISDSNAEEGCHKLFKRLGLSAPVEVNRFGLGDGPLKNVPYIKLSSWVKWLFNTHRLHRQMVGVATEEQMELVLGEWWKRFQVLFPDHQVFGMGYDMKRTIPFYSHSDEGRTYKSKPIYILSAHGVLGRGTEGYVRLGKHQKSVSELEMGLNFLGSTWSNHFIFCSIVRALLFENEDALDTISKQFAEDCEMLIKDGVTSDDGRHIRLLHLATKGDLPALAKLGHFLRSFSHCPRQAASRTPCVGICHLCRAGAEGQDPVSFEDFSARPLWLQTVEVKDPWNELPPILEGVLVQPGYLAHFFETDIWHNMHLGCLKHFIGSAFISILERLEHPQLSGSMDTKFMFLTDEFKKFCKSRHISPYMAEISKQTMSWPMASSCPVGAWSKGAVSTHFMIFLEHFFDTYLDDNHPDTVLRALVPGISLGKLSHLLVFADCIVVELRLRERSP